MAGKFTNTSSQEGSTFNKGMFKDLSDIYMSEGMWINAINAINNSHEGDSGNIGNEMANKYCASAPYTIIGVAHKIHKQWVLFSTNNTDHEIGIFDEADCSYTQVVNDSCLNFRQSNLITAAVKENYDCTWSVYWQDNRNPDRVLNLDNPPYICEPAPEDPPLVDETVDFYQYQISVDPDPQVDCGGSGQTSGGSQPQTFDINLGTDWGLVVLEFDALNVPDRFTVTWNGQVVIDTGNVGSGPQADYTLNGAAHPNYDLGQGPHPSSIYAGAGTAAFLKNADASTATVNIIPATSGTGWNCKLNCVVADSRAVRPPAPPIQVVYEDSEGITQIANLQPGDSQTICAKAQTINSFKDLPTDERFHIQALGNVCDTITRQVPDPNYDYCQSEICTDDLDCDALRLHPLVTQPCVEIKRATGYGQIQNGSYMAVIAYSENGIKLTDYSTPTYPVSVFDHSGIGGGLEVNLSDLDQDFDEYELVIIGVINQNTIAKRIGFYSTDQKKVTVDLIPESLVTINLANIPLRTAIYEKSERMSVVNNYLIRSAVTTQPYINYQKQANQIEVEWHATSYEYEYYRDGGLNVGYLRDEVYSFFIRWIYQTGNYTNSYHIPGRASLPSDLTTVTGSDDVVDLFQNKKWQVYDTSSVDQIINNPSDVVDTENNGLFKAKGKMGYWESTERYPIDQPDVWGDLCGKPIRHHKMPSAHTIHIHESGSANSLINVLGVKFLNVTHPVDENGDPITDIVGYEILRGSREGNRSIIAAGMFNNMREFPYDDDGESSTAPKYGLYQNYPYNDLRADYLLTRDPNLVLDGDAEGKRLREEADEFALTGYRNDFLSFHSPETAFIKPYIGSGSKIRIYREIYGTSQGHFRYPYKHPEHTLITDFAFISSVGVGFALGLVNALGKGTTSFQFEAGFKPLGIGVNVIPGASRETGGTAGGAIADTLVNAVTNVPGLPGVIMGVLGFITNFGYWAGQGIDQTLRTIRALSRDRQFALQYNSYCEFDQHKQYQNEYVTRITEKNNGVKYIGRGVQRMTADRVINNLNRNKYLCTNLTTGIPAPSVKDVSRNRLNDLRDNATYSEKWIYENPTALGFNKTASSYYGTVGFDFQNQYGQINSIQQIPISKCITYTKKIPNVNQYYASETGVLHGGDIYINRYTEKNPYMFFNTWLYDVPNGTELDYRNYINGPLPRYWVNFYPFQAEDFETKFRELFGRNNDTDIEPFAESPQTDIDTGDVDEDEEETDEMKDSTKNIGTRIKDFFKDAGAAINDGIDLVFQTPSDFQRLDRRKKVSGWFRLKDAYFYLFYNGIRDFYCESELNMALRDWSEKIEDQNFYDVYNYSFNDIDLMFRSDKITNPIYHKYDLSLSVSKLFNQFFSWGKILPRDYDPKVYSTCFKYFPRRSVYSLQHTNGQRRDNWKNYLLLNYRDFPGKVSTIKSLNKVGAVILFEDAEPMLFTGTDTIQTTGNTKFTIGDSALFADNNLKAMVNADDQIAFGTCISSRSAVNTPHGLFFISQDSGKIFQYAGQLIEISKNGMKHWFAENLPNLIRENDTTYSAYDNPVVGTGCQTIYDPTYELVYFMKKGYEKVTNETLFYDAENGVPYYKCGTRQPDDLVLDLPQASAGSATAAPDVPCLLDIVFALDDSGSTGSPTNSSTRAYGEIEFVYQFLSNPDVQQEMQDGNLQVGIALWNTINTGKSMNPNTFSMSSTITPQEVKDWLVANWRGGGTYIREGLIIGQEVLDEKSSAELGDRTSDSNFRQYIIHVGDSTAGLSAAEADCGCPYQSPLLGGGGPYPYQEVIAVFAGINPPVPNQPVFDALTCNNSATNFYEVYTSNPSSYQTVANDLVDNTCGIQLSCSLDSTAVSVQEGENLLLTWSTIISGELMSSATATLSSPSMAGDLQVALNGSATVYPVSAPSETWTLTVTDGQGGSTTCEFTVEVTERPLVDTYCDCPYDDPNCFEPKCWTVSYDPKNKMWISFHDWCPTLAIPSNQHFNTVLDNAIWKHNDRYDKYCNYYGVDYAWEVEYPVMNLPAVNTLRNIEYTLDVFKYDANGKDKLHILDENFDRAVLYNSEQISGLLKLSIKGKNTPAANLTNFGTVTTGDILGTSAYNIKYSKEENKYRFNQFWDITNNRGEFVPSAELMFNTRADGYRKDINELYVNYNKPFTQRKKFRHYGNRLILRKTLSNDKKMVLKLVTSKQLLSRM